MFIIGSFVYTVFVLRDIVSPLRNLAIGKLQLAPRELLWPQRIVRGHNHRHTRLANTVEQLHNASACFGI